MCDQITRSISCHHSRSAHRQGFTLVELLVVIAILSLLIAILLPSLKKARESAKAVKCLTHIHQICVAWQVYLDDSNGFFYSGDNANLNYGGRQGDGSWKFGNDPGRPVYKPLNPYLSLEPVLKEAEVFRCSSEEGDTLITPTAYHYYGTSYPANRLLISNGPPLCNWASNACMMDSIIFTAALGVHMKSIRESQVSQGPPLVLVGDYGWHLSYFPGVHSVEPRAPHGREMTFNLGFLDGSASPVKMEFRRWIYPDIRIVPFREPDLDKLSKASQECVLPPEDGEKHRESHGRDSFRR